MDWSSIITGLIGAVAAAGGVGGIFQLKENKRAKQLENDRSAAAEWKDLYEKVEKKADDVGRKLDEAYITIFKLRNEAAESREAFIRAEMLTCKKRACVDRDPPLGTSSTTKIEA